MEKACLPRTSEIRGTIFTGLSTVADDTPEERATAPRTDQNRQSEGVARKSTEITGCAGARKAKPGRDDCRRAPVLCLNTGRCLCALADFPGVAGAEKLADVACAALRGDFLYLAY